MAKDSLQYDRMLQEALRGVVRAALEEVAEHGFPGDHHFLITFRTDHPGAALSDRLRAQYPSEMTIVLQHQFWGLDVGADAFAVTLSFQKVQERLTVPFAAVTRFVDPPANFGLQLQASASDGTPLAPLAEGKAEEGAAEAPADTETEPAGKVVALDNFRKS